MTPDTIDLLEEIAKTLREKGLDEAGVKTPQGTQFRVVLKNGKTGWVRTYDMGSSGKAASIYDHRGKKLHTTGRYLDTNNLDKELRKHLKKWNER